MNDISATWSTPVDNVVPTVLYEGGRVLPSSSAHPPEEHPTHRRGGVPRTTTSGAIRAEPAVDNRWTVIPDTPSTGVDNVCAQLWACGADHTSSCSLTCANACPRGVEKKFLTPVRCPQ